MEALVKSTDQRKIRLLEYLMQTEQWSTTLDLSSLLGCSERVIKDDLQYFRENHPGLVIISSSEGVKMHWDSSIGIQDFYIDIMKESLTFKILEEIFFDETLSTLDLADILHASSSTIYRTIDQLNTYFERFNCQIERNPCRFVGDEYYIRRFYRTYFKERYTIFEWPFKIFTQETIHNSFDFIFDTLNQVDDISDISTDFASHRKIQSSIVVNLIRLQNGHWVDIPEDTLFQESIFFKMFLSYLPSVITSINFQSTVYMHKDSALVYQIYYPYLNEKFAYSQKTLLKMRQRYAYVDESIQAIEQQLDALALDYAIPVATDKLSPILYGNVMFEEHNTESMHILYDRNNTFNLTVAKQFPTLYQRMYALIAFFRKSLGHDEDDDEKNQYLLYILFISWDNLLPALYAKRSTVRVIVISDRHHTHAVTIKNLLAESLSPCVKISAYQGNIFNYESLTRINDDLVVSTFRLPENYPKKNIVVGQYIRYRDIDLIQKAVTEIMEAKGLDS